MKKLKWWTVAYEVIKAAMLALAGMGGANQIGL